jgi:hypothetical protein
MKITKSQLKRIIKEEVLKLVEGDVIKFPGSKRPSASKPSQQGDAEVISMADRRKQQQFGPDDLTRMADPNIDWEEVEETIKEMAAISGIEDAFDALDIDVGGFSKNLWMPFLSEMNPRLKSAMESGGSREKIANKLYKLTLKVMVDIGAATQEQIEQLPNKSLENFSHFLKTTPEKLLSALVKKGYIANSETFTVDEMGRAFSGVVGRARRKLDYKQRRDDRKGGELKNLKQQARIILGLEKAQKAPAADADNVDSLMGSALFRKANTADKRTAKRKLRKQAKKDFFEEGGWAALGVELDEKYRSPLSVRLAKAAGMDYLDWAEELADLWSEEIFDVDNR